VVYDAAATAHCVLLIAVYYVHMVFGHRQRSQLHSSSKAVGADLAEQQAAALRHRTACFVHWMLLTTLTGAGGGVL
jgi:hypothetical protein